MSPLAIIQLLRPQQYLKNLFILSPVFFAMKINQPALLINSFIAFCAFSVSASGIYILNDYFDMEEDRKHPIKKFRPLASGAVGIPFALSVMVILIAVGISVMSHLGKEAVYLLLGYLLLNLAYSTIFKHIPILDITIIGIGFVLRLFIGSAVTGVSLSMWIVVVTFLLALFLALAKRRDDVLIFLETNEKMRKSVDGYNLKFLDGSIIIMAAVVVVSYILYTVSPEVTERIKSEHLYLTAIFVLMGILRYLQITFVEEKSGSPTAVLLKDRFLQLVLLGWICTFALIIYNT